MLSTCSSQVVDTMGDSVKMTSPGWTSLVATTKRPTPGSCITFTASEAAGILGLELLNLSTSGIPSLSRACQLSWSGSTFSVTPSSLAVLARVMNAS